MPINAKQHATLTAIVGRALTENTRESNLTLAVFARTVYETLLRANSDPEWGLGSAAMMAVGNHIKKGGTWETLPLVERGVAEAYPNKCAIRLPLIRACDLHLRASLPKIFFIATEEEKAELEKISNSFDTAELMALTQALYDTIRKFSEKTEELITIGKLIYARCPWEDVPRESLQAKTVKSCIVNLIPNLPSILKVAEEVEPEPPAGSTGEEPAASAAEPAPGPAPEPVTPAIEEPAAKTDDKIAVEEASQNEEQDAQSGAEPSNGQAHSQSRGKKRARKQDNKEATDE